MDAGQFISAVVEALFKKDWEALGTELNSLVTRNGLLGNPATGFLYGGKYWSNTSPALHRTHIKKIIHPDLRVEAAAFADRYNEVSKETHNLTFSLKRWLSKDTSLQDIRDLFPDIVISLVPEAKALPRTRPAGFRFEQQPLLAHQFQVTLDTIEYHISNRLF